MGQVKRSFAPRPDRPPLVPIDRIKDGLNARVLELCAELLPRGIRDGREWRVGSPAGEPGRSMAVHLGGSKPGVWQDFASGEVGDSIDLVAQVLFNGAKGEAIKWSLSWLGLDGRDHQRLQTTRRAVEARARAPDPEQDEKKHRGGAFRIWLSAEAGIAGTPVERYLRGRGIDFAALGRVPRALRFHPALWNVESQRKWPAMVAAIADHEGTFVAVHRTWLEVHPDGRVAKAPLVDNKMTLGRFGGGAIRLWRGASGKSLRDAPDGETVVLAEGIEDGGSVVVACPEHRVLAAVSLANMGSLVLPRSVARVVICVQNDPWREGESERAHAAMKGLDRAIRHFSGQGREVAIARSAVGKDMNDLLRGAT